MSKLKNSYFYTNNQENFSYYIRAVDKAGNVSSWSTNPYYVKIDKIENDCCIGHIIQ